MPLEEALHFLKVCAWLSLAGLALSALYAAMFGGLDLDGLLTDKSTKAFSVARLQLVGTTIVLAILYLQEVARSTGHGDMPVFDETQLAALSGGAYGLAKLNSSLRASTGLSLLETLLGSQRRPPQ